LARCWPCTQAECRITPGNVFINGRRHARPDVVAFYLLQRRGLFARLARLTATPGARRDWSKLVGRAETIDQAIENTHGPRDRIAASFALSLVGWLVGTGEVYWMLGLLGTSGQLERRALLESLGQAIRGAGFAIPGSSASRKAVIC